VGRIVAILEHINEPESHYYTYYTTTRTIALISYCWSSLEDLRVELGDWYGTFTLVFCLFWSLGESGVVRVTGYWNVEISRKTIKPQVFDNPLLRQKPNNLSDSTCPGLLRFSIQVGVTTSTAGALV